MYSYTGSVNHLQNKDLGSGSEGFCLQAESHCQVALWWHLLCPNVSLPTTTCHTTPQTLQHKALLFPAAATSSVEDIQHS